MCNMKVVIMYKTDTPKWMNQLMIYDSTHSSLVYFVDPTSRTRRVSTGHAGPKYRIRLKGIAI